MSITSLIFALLPAIAGPKSKPDPDLAYLIEENARLRAANDVLRDRLYWKGAQIQPDYLESAACPASPASPPRPIPPERSTILQLRSRSRFALASAIGRPSHHDGGKSFDDFFWP